MQTQFEFGDLFRGVGGILQGFDADHVQILTSVELTMEDVVCTHTALIHQAASSVLAEKAFMATGSSAPVQVVFSLYLQIIF